mgnify:CR=1 FL=1
MFILVIKRLWCIFEPVLSAIIGLWLLNCFNIFEKIPNIPPDYVYEIGITVYFAVVSSLLEIGYYLIVSKLKPVLFSELELIFVNINADPDIEYNPQIRFNSEGTAEIDISISVKGKRKHFKNSIIEIKSPGFADIQQNKKSHGVSVNSDTYSINLEEIIGTGSTVELKRTFRIVFADIPTDGDSQAIVKPELKNKNMHILYKYNGVCVKVRGN